MPVPRIFNRIPQALVPRNHLILRPFGQMAPSCAAAALLIAVPANGRPDLSFCWYRPLRTAFTTVSGTSRPSDFCTSISLDRLLSSTGETAQTII
jgi:hypothetical protein